MAANSTLGQALTAAAGAVSAYAPPPVTESVPSNVDTSISTVEADGTAALAEGDAPLC